MRPAVGETGRRLTPVDRIVGRNRLPGNGLTEH
jgi:hypothetical protein